MKINAKLLILTFTIIAFISIVSAFIYHTLTKELLLTQQSKNLINSANNFIFSYQQYVDNLDEDFQKNFKDDQITFADSEIDFYFSAKNDSLISSNIINLRFGLKIYTDVTTLKEFFDLNRNLIVRQKRIDGETLYYGKIINTNILNSLSEKIRADIAFVENGVISFMSNNIENEQYLPYLSKAARELNEKNNFELIKDNVYNYDLFVTHYSALGTANFGKELDFIVFSISNEAYAFRNTMNIVTLVIVIAGIFLTIVFLFLFTGKLRKQLEYISNSVNAIAKGKLDTRVKIISNDEIGKLGEAFNNMLDEIEKQENYEKEYTEFIALINKNPSLEEIGDVTIKKIISLTNVNVGAIYLLENNILTSLSSYGVPQQQNKTIEESSFYKRAIENEDLIEIQFEDNHPVVKTGLAELKINYLYILPIIYNNRIIAIVELASVNKPISNVRDYYNKIKDQLAIGIANGKAFNKLQKLVDELQRLNFAYQQQNTEITEKNIELLDLHDKLKKGTEELEVQRSKAVESAKLKSQFLANMSHELRTPQNSILGLTELILNDKTTDSKTRERLNVVLRNGKKLLNLIENILEFSKLESGNISVTESEILLSDLIGEVKSFISPIFLERELSFKINYPEDCDYLLRSDIKKIEQIVYNLVGNAAKFTKEGYVKLLFDVHDTDLVVSVEDSGPGILEEDRKIIFEEFRQADASLNRKFSGTGLGLAICKRYSDLLQGEIKVISEIGAGSKFIVHLPQVIKSVHPNDFSKTEVTQLGRAFKAIIISEGEDAIKLIGDYLKSNDILVESPNLSGFNFDTILKSLPDVIILDVLAKELNGWQLLNELKKNKTLLKIPVVLINMDEEANCGFGFNIYDFVADEFNRSNIIKAVENIEKIQSIKFRKILLVQDDEQYIKNENELISDNIKIYHANGKSPICDLIKQYDPDLIMVDLYSNKFDSFRIINDINEDIFSKNIPVISFIHDLSDIEEINRINNSLFETTLVLQHHPLDVLKIIRDRIELIDVSIFQNNNSTVSNVPSIKYKSTISSKKESDTFSVLVVDDDQDARFTIGEIIKSLGYNPLYASDGFECIEILTSEKPDLILLDIMMPQMDGFQTIKKIRNNISTKELKVFALTAYAMLSDREIIEKNGFDGLFSKPINTVQLENKLKSIFNFVV